MLDGVQPRDTRSSCWSLPNQYYVILVEMLSSQNVVILTVIILTSFLSFDTAAKAQEGYQVCKDLLQLSSEVLF